MKEFVKNVIDFFDIGVNGTHVAIVTFSTYSNVEFNFDSYTNKVAMKAAVSAISYPSGFTYTGDAIDKTRNEVM